MVKAARPAKRKTPAKPAATKKKTPPRAKAKAAKSKPKKAKPKAKSNLLGGVAKGIAWLGDKVRGVVQRKPKKKRKAAKAKPTKPASSGAGSSETLVTLRNPLP